MANEKSITPLIITDNGTPCRKGDRVNRPCDQPDGGGVGFRPASLCSAVPFSRDALPSPAAIIVGAAAVVEFRFFAGK